MEEEIESLSNRSNRQRLAAQQLCTDRHGRNLTVEANPQFLPTPPRTPSPRETVEASPTDSNFTEDGIFDSPYPRRYGEFLPSSPITPLTPSAPISYEEDVFVDKRLAIEAPYRNTVDASSTDSHSVEHGGLDLPVSSGYEESIASSLLTYSALSELDEQHDGFVDKPRTDTALANPSFTLKPDHRIVWITSCYQCLLANLPCSRTWPACSRCRRKSCSEVCLLQRRRFIEETGPHMGYEEAPTLLISREEPAELVQKKIELLRELDEGWRAQLDRRNWVLPAADRSPRGVFRDHGRKIEQTHPGLGMGHITQKELPVVLLEGAEAA